MTCFDFGLKARLLGVPCRLEREAQATHSGYLSRALTAAVSAAEGHVHAGRELRARLLLLYAKFFPPGERAYAERVLREKVERWRATHYPHLPSLSGTAMDQVFSQAVAEVEWLRQSICPIWVERAARLDMTTRQRLLLGISES